MATGRVVQFDDQRGYGFIEPDDGGEDVFMHASVLDCPGDALVRGVRVGYQMVQTDRGRRAASVSILGGPRTVPASVPVPVTMVAQTAIAAEAMCCSPWRRT